jgi:hypothetical protein
VGDDTLWGVVRRRKSVTNTPGGDEVVPGARPDGKPIYVILDNLSAHKSKKLRDWCAGNNGELCFTPTCSNPIESHVGPLHDVVLNNSDHPNHTVLTRGLHAYLSLQHRSTAASAQQGRGCFPGAYSDHALHAACRPARDHLAENAPLPA